LEENPFSVFLNPLTSCLARCIRDTASGIMHRETRAQSARNKNSKATQLTTLHVQIHFIGKWGRNWWSFLKRQAFKALSALTFNEAVIPFEDLRRTGMRTRLFPTDTRASPESLH
jgi:hypothetical protein